MVARCLDGPGAVALGAWKDVPHGDGRVHLVVGEADPVGRGDDLQGESQADGRWDGRERRNQETRNGLERLAVLVDDGHAASFEDDDVSVLVKVEERSGDDGG